MIGNFTTHSDSFFRRKKHGGRRILGLVGNDKSEVAAMLLQQNANINTSDRSRTTPLISALFWNQHDVVALLLKHKADVELETSDASLTGGYGEAQTAFYVARDPQIKRMILIAELDLFLQTLPASSSTVFNKTAESVLLLKKALSENDFEQVRKLNFSTWGKFGELYKKALWVGELYNREVISLQIKQTKVGKVSL